MEHQKFKHNLDNHDCADRGFSAEIVFKQLAEEKGYSVEVCGRQLQFSHIDFILKKDKKIWKIDIKAAKRLSRQSEKPNFDFIWCELKNCRGKDGWLLGGSTSIAFELEKEFIIVGRKDLLELVKKLCNFEKMVGQSKNALYCGYKRFKRQDLLTLIKTSDLYKIPHSIWPKESIKENQK